MAYTRVESPLQNRGVQKGQNAWRDIIDAGKSLKAPTICSICKDAMEKIATAPLKGGAERFACTWCQQRYNVIVLAERDKPDQAHPDFGAF
jgi:hypothetical protein